jgi:hypothetical protein
MTWKDDPLKHFDHRRETDVSNVISKSVNQVSNERDLKNVIMVDIQNEENENKKTPSTRHGKCPIIRSDDLLETSDKQ